MTHVVVATGTIREAAALRGQGLTVIAGGGDAEALARRLEAEDAKGFVSFGMAGALVEGLAIGDWIVGDRVTGAIDRACDAGWSAALAAALPRARVGALRADGRMVSTVAEKRALAVGGAIAVDMESHVAARVAAARGLPFVIVRCISDPADRALPPAVAVSMRPDGGVDVVAVLRSLIAHPGQIGALAATGVGFARAMRALERGAAALGPVLASLR